MERGREELEKLKRGGKRNNREREKEKNEKNWEKEKKRKREKGRKAFIKRSYEKRQEKL